MERQLQIAKECIVLREDKYDAFQGKAGSPSKGIGVTLCLAIYILVRALFGATRRVLSAVVAHIQCRGPLRPNCHRQMHYGKLASDMRATVLSKVTELRHE